MFTETEYNILQAAVFSYFNLLLRDALDTSKDRNYRAYLKKHIRDVQEIQDKLVAIKRNKSKETIEEYRELKNKTQGEIK